ncbi:MAG: zinc ABC transporter solute-binding protein [Clostridia bacterium]|nr:zinc ABC transporter solute-binding protein [Clostridia bacterium]
MKRFTVVILLLQLLLAAFLISGCTENPKKGNPHTGRTKVYTSIHPIYYLASEIAGDHADIVEILPPSSDPHTYEPSPKEIVDLQSSDLFIYNGAGLEPWAEKVAGSLGENVSVLQIAEVVYDQLPQGNDPGYPVDTADPHFWLDPVMAKNMAEAIAETLIKVDKKNKDSYGENFTSLALRLDGLHRDYDETLRKCEGKEFVVTHGAFGYLAARYDLKQISIMGMGEESEPNPAYLGELIKLLKTHGIGYIFSEPLSSIKVTKTLADETQSEILFLNPIGTLTKEQESRGENYMTLMYDNLEQLKIALGQNE